MLNGKMFNNLRERNVELITRHIIFLLCDTLLREADKKVDLHVYFERHFVDFVRDDELEEDR